MIFTLLFLPFQELWDAYPMVFGHEHSDYRSKDLTASVFPTQKNQNDLYLENTHIFFNSKTFKHCFLKKVKYFVI